MSNPEVCREITRRARKDHVCCECNNRIKKGRKYIELVGLWDGRWATYRTCTVCHQALLDAMASLPSTFDAPLIGELWECLSDSDVAQPLGAAVKRRMNETKQRGIENE